MVMVSLQHHFIWVLTGSYELVNNFSNFTCSASSASTSKQDHIKEPIHIIKNSSEQPMWDKQERSEVENKNINK